MLENGLEAMPDVSVEIVLKDRLSELLEVVISVDNQLLGMLKKSLED